MGDENYFPILELEMFAVETEFRNFIKLLSNGNKKEIHNCLSDLKNNLFTLHKAIRQSFTSLHLIISRLSEEDLEEMKYKAVNGGLFLSRARWRILTEEVSQPSKNRYLLDKLMAKISNNLSSIERMIYYSKQNDTTKEKIIILLTSIDEVKLIVRFTQVFGYETKNQRKNTPALKVIEGGKNN